MCFKLKNLILLIGLTCWTSLAIAAGPSCSDRFLKLLVPRIQIPAPILAWARDPYNEDYKNLYRWMNNNGINPRSYDAQKEATLIAIRQLKQMGFGIEEMSISSGLAMDLGPLLSTKHEAMLGNFKKGSLSR